MPRFRDSDNPALNPELEIKKEVLKRNRNRFQGDESFSSVPPMSDGSPDKYTALYKLLTSINASYGEVTNVLDIYTQEAGKSAGSSGLADRFTGTATTLSQLLKQANAFLKSIRYDLTDLSIDQLKSIEREYSELKANEERFDEDFDTLKGLGEGAPTQDEMIQQQMADDISIGIQDYYMRTFGEIPPEFEPIDVKEAKKRSSTAQQLRYRRKRFENIEKLFSVWHRQYLTFVKNLGDALNATNQIIVGSGYGDRMIGGLLPSHFIQTSNYLPRRFI